MVICILICAATVVLDFATKAAVTAYLKPVGKLPIIDGVFNLTYLENRGAAFGMLSEHRWIFMVLSAAAIVALLAYLWYARKRDLMMRISLSLIAGGGIGNMIDRICRGYVVDMFDLVFMDYPIFNLADCFVVIGCILGGIYYMWIHDDGKKKKKEQHHEGETDGQQ